MSGSLPLSKTVIARLAIEAPMVLESAGMKRTAISAQLVHRRSNVFASLAEERARAAIVGGDEERALMDVERCPNVNAADDLGVTLYHHAAQMGMLRVCDHLAGRRANPNATTVLGESVLSYAIACNADAEQPRNHLYGVIAHLLENGADGRQPDAVDNRLLPEQIAAQVGDTGSLAVLYRFIKKFEPETLVAAAFSRQRNALHFLLWAGTDPRPNVASSLWPRAVLKGKITNETFAGRNLKLQAEVLARAEAIAMARESVGLPIVGADLTAVPNTLRQFQDIATLAMMQDDQLLHEQAMLLLGEMRGFKPLDPASAQSELVRAAATNHVPMLLHALRTGASASLPDGMGRTPFLAAAVNTALDAMDILFRQRVNVDEPDVLDRTPLIYCALSGNVLVVNKLLQLGANPFCAAHDGKTASELVASLVKAKAGTGVKADSDEMEAYGAIHDMLLFAEQNHKPAVMRQLPKRAAPRRILH